MSEITFIEYLYSIGIVDYDFLKKNRSDVLRKFAMEFIDMTMPHVVDMLERIYLIWVHKCQIPLETQINIQKQLTP